MTCTYVKRYAQQALLNISTEEDDDASLNGSSKPTAGKSAAPASANGHGHTPPTEPTEGLEHPTEGHLAALKNLACTKCGEEVEVYEGRLRQMMKLPKQASVSPRLLRKSMTMATYMDMFAYYRRLEAQLAKGKEPSGANASTNAAPPEPTTPRPRGGSSRGPFAGHILICTRARRDADATGRDRQRLRTEVAAWDV